MVKMFEDVSDEVLANEFKHEGYHRIDIEYTDGQKLVYGEVAANTAFPLAQRLMDLTDVRSVTVSR